MATANPAVQGISSVDDVLKLLNETLDQATKKLKENTQGLDKWTKTMATAVDGANKLTSSLSALPSAIAKITSANALLTNSSKLASSLLQGSANAVGAGLGLMNAALGEAVAGIGGMAASVVALPVAFIAAAGALAGVGSSIAGMVALLNPAAVLPFELVMRDLQAVLGEKLAPILNVITTIFRNIADEILNNKGIDAVIQELASALLALWHEAIEPLIPILISILIPVIRLFATVLRTLIPIIMLITPVLKILADTINYVVTALTSFIGWLGKLIGKLNSKKDVYEGDDPNKSKLENDIAFRKDEIKKLSKDTDPVLVRQREYAQGELKRLEALRGRESSVGKAVVPTQFKGFEEIAKSAQQYAFQQVFAKGAKTPQEEQLDEQRKTNEKLDDVNNNIKQANADNKQAMNKQQFM